MDKLKDYLKNIEFKKRKVGGLDEEDVLRHIKKISELVSEELERRGNSDEEAIQKMQKELDDARTKAKKYRTAISKLKEVNTDLENRILYLQKNPPQYDAFHESAEHSQEDCDRKYKELATAISALNNVKKEEERGARNRIQKMLERELADGRAENREKLEREGARARAEMQAKLEEERRRLQARVKEERQQCHIELERERRRAAEEVKKLNDEIDALRQKKQTLQETAGKESVPREESFAREGYTGFLDDIDLDFGDLIGYEEKEESI